MSSCRRQLAAARRVAGPTQRHLVGGAPGAGPAEVEAGGNARPRSNRNALAGTVGRNRQPETEASPGVERLADGTRRELDRRALAQGAAALAPVPHAYRKAHR